MIQAYRSCYIIYIISSYLYLILFAGALLFFRCFVLAVPEIPCLIRIQAPTGGALVLERFGLSAQSNIDSERGKIAADDSDSEKAHAFGGFMNVP